MAPEALTRFLNLGIDVVNPVTLNPWFKLGAWLFLVILLYRQMVLDGTTGQMGYHNTQRSHTPTCSMFLGLDWYTPYIPLKVEVLIMWKLWVWLFRLPRDVHCVAARTSCVPIGHKEHHRGFDFYRISMVFMFQVCLFRHFLIFL